jgi:hypothetical protein
VNIPNECTGSAIEHRADNVIDRAVAVPHDEALKAGILPDQVKIREKYGGGFPANVEGLHHLHCLVTESARFEGPNNSRAIRTFLGNQNLLRQSLYYNFEYYHSKGKGAFKNPDHILRFHVCMFSFSSLKANVQAEMSSAHCLDILRQQLMCIVDIGVLGQVWWNKQAPTAYVDFNTKHKCRNFDAVRQWAEEHQMPEGVPLDYLQPPELEDTVYDEIP